MLLKLSPKLIVPGAVFLLLVSIIYAVYTVMTLPENYPDRTLTIGEQIQSFIHRITLPIKIAKLSLEDPDKELLMPVYGVRISQVSDTFLADRDGGERSHEGQDIFAPRNTPVFSATRGYVTRITDKILGGRSVFITGAGGRRYFYTHFERYADNLKVGDYVTTDTVIGFVGNDGNAATTPTHLHFGVYENREAINPLPLIVNR